MCHYSCFDVDLSDLLVDGGRGGRGGRRPPNRRHSIQVGAYSHRRSSASEAPLGNEMLYNFAMYYY